MGFELDFKTTNRENAGWEIRIAEQGRTGDQWICFPEKTPTCKDNAR